MNIQYSSGTVVHKDANSDSTRSFIHHSILISGTHHTIWYNVIGAPPTKKKNMETLPHLNRTPFPQESFLPSMIFQVAIMCKHHNSVSSSHGMTYHTGHVLPQFETSKRNKRVYTYKVVVSTCVSTSSSGSTSTRIGVNMRTTKNETTTYTYIPPNNNLPPSIMLLPLKLTKKLQIFQFPHPNKMPTLRTCSNHK